MDLVILALIIVALLLVAVEVIQSRTISLLEAAVACLGAALLVWRLA